MRKYVLIISSLFLFSCEEEDIQQNTSMGLIINEFLASNDSCCADESNDYDDWVEIYNDTSDPIDIGGMYFTDTPDDDNPYQIPNTDPSVTTIPSKGYLVIWCDDDQEQGPLHASKKWVNKLMGSSIYILAGNAYNWQIQHNVLHHTYTNIHGHDEDLDAGRILRFSEHSKWKPHHRFQHFYSFLLYGLMTINWAIITDYFQTRRYIKRKLSFKKFVNPTKQWINLIITKILYYSIWIVLPILILDLAWWKILIGFFIMHYTAGIILSTIFQLAHIVEKVKMPLPTKELGMKNTWAIHQLFTTSNFSTNNKIMNWFSGGLNFQVEHHLFPNISHIHYKKLSEIVKNTAREFNLPYNEYKTTREALKSHFLFLKSMAKKPLQIA